MRKPVVNIEEYRNQLKNYFLRLTPKIVLEELNELVEQFTVDKFSKKEIILKAGEHSDTVYFVYEGLVRIYYVKEDKENTNWFITAIMKRWKILMC